MVDLTDCIEQGIEKARRGGGGSAPRQPWYCPKCEERRGVAARSMLHRIVLGATVDADGFVIGGREVYACWHCMAAGKMTIAGRALDGTIPVV